MAMYMFTLHLAKYQNIIPEINLKLLNRACHLPADTLGAHYLGTANNA